MLRSIAELAAYGTLATLLTVASVAPKDAARSAPPATTAQTSAARVPAESAPAPAAGRDRGILLFAAKGCIGCHTHAALPSARMRIGPDLTDLAQRAASRVSGLDARGYVAQSLREPGSFLAPGYSTPMPDLPITEEQIESLTAFLLSPDR